MEIANPLHLRTIREDFVLVVVSRSRLPLRRAPCLLLTRHAHFFKPRLHPFPHQIGLQILCLQTAITLPPPDLLVSYPPKMSRNAPVFFPYSDALAAPFNTITVDVVSCVLRLRRARLFLDYPFCFAFPRFTRARSFRIVRKHFSGILPFSETLGATPISPVKK